MYKIWNVKVRYSEQVHLRSALAKKRQDTLTLSKPSEASANILRSELPVLLFKQDM